MQAVVLFILLIVAFIIGPVLGLWAINTLFEQGNIPYYIPHNFWSYLAMWALIGSFKSNGHTPKWKSL